LFVDQGSGDSVGHGGLFPAYARGARDSRTIVHNAQRASVKYSMNE
jgi:hypothetical protein